MSKKEAYLTCGKSPAIHAFIGIFISTLTPKDWNDSFGKPI